MHPLALFALFAFQTNLSDMFYGYSVVFRTEKGDGRMRLSKFTIGAIAISCMSSFCCDLLFIRDSNPPCICNIWSCVLLLDLCKVL